MRKTLHLVAATLLAAAPGIAFGQAAAGAAPSANAAPSATAGQTGATASAPAASAGASPSGTGAAAASSANANAKAAPVTAGLTVKDNQGVEVGQVTDDAPVNGKSMATIKMGGKTFRVAASSLAVENGAAVINLTSAQLQQQLGGAAH